MPPGRSFLRLVETLAIGTLGGAILTVLGIPAGWLSGAMLAVAGAALAGRPVTIPAPLARVVFVLIGISLGGAVTPETLRGVATWPLSVLLLCIGMTCSTFASAWYLRKVHGWDMLSALFGSAPGALSQVIAHATQHRSDLRGIAIVQTVRVVILTACLPAALAAFALIPPAPPAQAMAGAYPLVEILVLTAVSAAAAVLVHRLRFPGGLIFGAMLASAVLHGSGIIQATMPGWIVSAVMVALGALTGSRFAGTDLRTLLVYGAAALGSFSVAVAVVALFAAAAGFMLTLKTSDLVVSYAPGALDAMMMVALALHLDPIFVGAHHVARFMLVSLSLPVFVALFGHKASAPPRAPEKRPVQED